MKRIIIAMCLWVLIPNVFAGVNTRCDVVTCAAGSKVISYAKKNEPYYMCPTRELAEYTNFVIGLVFLSVQISGKMPNISPITGEPEYVGETKTRLDRMRDLAGVSNFDQAVASCKLGKNALHMFVTNNPKDGNLIWVSDEKSKKLFWMPKGYLNLR